MAAIPPPRGRRRMLVSHMRHRFCAGLEPILAALAGARAMRDVYLRVFAPPFIDGRVNPDHLERPARRRVAGFVPARHEATT